MADINYNNHASKAAPTVDDFIPIWDVAAAQSKKATIANIINARLTGGGIIATGGNTLTVPATGTASLLGTIQTYTALKTFSGGLSLGEGTLTNYNLDNWTPGLIGSTTPGSNTYTSQIGRFVRVGMVVFLWYQVQINVKDGAMAGDVVMTGLPYTARTTLTQVAGSVVPASLATNVVKLDARATPGTTTVGFRKMAAAAASTAALVAGDVQNSTLLAGFLVYETV